MFKMYKFGPTRYLVSFDEPTRMCYHKVNDSKCLLTKRIIEFEENKMLFSKNDLKYVVKIVVNLLNTL